MFGRPEAGAAGFANAGEASAAAGNVGFTIGTEPGAIGCAGAGTAAGTAVARRSTGMTPAA